MGNRYNDVLGEGGRCRNGVGGEGGRRKCDNGVGGEGGRRCDCDCFRRCLIEFLEDLLDALEEENDHHCHR